MTTFKDYSFDEWKSLETDEKVYIIKHVWSPFKKIRGQKTRAQILNEFKKSLKEAPLYCEYRYFGYYDSAIYVVVKNKKTRVPKMFEGVRVNKGVIVEKIQQNVWKVKWRDTGVEVFNSQTALKQQIKV